MIYQLKGFKISFEFFQGFLTFLFFRKLIHQLSSFKHEGFFIKGCINGKGFSKNVFPNVVVIISSVGFRFKIFRIFSGKIYVFKINIYMARLKMFLVIYISTRFLFSYFKH